MLTAVLHCLRYYFDSDLHICAGMAAEVKASEPDSAKVLPSTPIVDGLRIVLLSRLRGTGPSPALAAPGGSYEPQPEPPRKGVRFDGTNHRTYKKSDPAAVTGEILPGSGEVSMSAPRHTPRQPISLKSFRLLVFERFQGVACRCDPPLVTMHRRHCQLRRLEMNGTLSLFHFGKRHFDKPRVLPAVSPAVSFLPHPSCFAFATPPHLRYRSSP
jgi:hypothetical protein